MVTFVDVIFNPDEDLTYEEHIMLNGGTELLSFTVGAILTIAGMSATTIFVGGLAVSVLGNIAVEMYKYTKIKRKT